MEVMAYIPIYVSFKRFEKYCVNVLQMDALGIKEFWDDLFNDPEGRMDFFGDEWHIKVLLLEDPSPLTWEEKHRAISIGSMHSI